MFKSIMAVFGGICGVALVGLYGYITGIETQAKNPQVYDKFDDISETIFNTKTKE